MPTDTNLSQLVINELTKAQYEALTPVSNQLYITTDEGIEITDVNNLQSTLNNKVEDLEDLGITATSTELNYVDGVTSNIQNQLDSKISYEIAED